jgi:PKD repeat protein
MKTIKSNLLFNTSSIFFIFLFFIKLSLAQSFCATLPLNTANTTDPNLMYYDRFGNSYDMTIGEFSLPASITLELNSFILSFEGTNDFTQNQIDASVRAFEYLETIIEKRVQITECGDEVNSPKAFIRFIKRDLSTEQFEPGTLGIGSPIFMPNAQGTPSESSAKGCNGQGKYLNSPSILDVFNGLNNYNSEGYDGRIFITNAVPFYTDETSPNGTNSNLYDLFTVVLHEAMHILAFHPSLTLNSFQNINRFDLLCKDDTGMPFLDNQCSSMCYSSSYNESQLSECEVTIGENNLPASSTFNLAHLANGQNGCGISDALMTTTLLPSTRKYLSNDEVNILCEVGYKLKNGCDGKYSQPVQLHIQETPEICSDYAFCCPSEFRSCENFISISKEDLRCLTHSNLGEPEIVDIKTSSSALSFQNLNNEIIFTSTTKAEHYAVIGYKHQISAGECLITSRTIELKFDPSCTDCNSYNLCNDLLCLKNFDDLPNWPQFNFGYPYIFETACHNSPNTIPYEIDNKVLQLVPGESITAQVGETTIENCGFKLSLDAISMDNKITVWGSENPPCNFNDKPIPYQCNVITQCNDYEFRPFCLAEIPIQTSNGFESFDVIFNIPEELVDFKYIIITSHFEVSPVLEYANIIIIDNIRLAVETCAQDASFSHEIFTCNFVEFTPLYSNDKQSHHWDFGDGNTSNLENGYNNYLTPGTYTVTHTIVDHCGNDDISTETVIIEDCAEACPDFVFVGNQPLQCSEEDPLVATFSFRVADGAQLCDGPLEFSGGTITNPYIEITPSPNRNILHGSVELNDPDGIFHITICDQDGNELCYLIGFETPKDCDKCSELPAIEMSCVDDDLTDDITSYFTNITIDLSADFETQCGITASHPNLEFSNFQPIGSIVSFDLNLTSSIDVDLSSGFETTICITTIDGNECFKINVNIPEPCAVGCDNEYDNPNLPTYNCSFVDSNTGIAEFPIGPIILVSVPPLKEEGWEICDIDPGTVPDGGYLFDYSTYELNNSGLQTATIKLLLGLPCSLFENGPIEITVSLNLCGPADATDCLDLVVTLGCDECENKKRSTIVGEEEITFFPNPAKDRITIVSQKHLLPYRLEIINQNGQVVMEKNISNEDEMVNISNIISGIYFLKPIHEIKNLNIEKIIIID